MIDDEAGLAELRPQWERVLADSAQQRPFLTHDWIGAWWRTRADPGRLHVLALEDASGELAAIMPMYSARQGRAVGVNAGRLLADRGVGSTGLGPFARKEVEGEAFRRFLTYLRDGKHGWDVIDLDFLDPTSPFYSLVRGSRGAVASGPSGRCPIVELPADFDSFLGGLPSGRAKNVRRCLAKAEESGAAFEKVTDPGALPAALEDLWRLHERHLRRIHAGHHVEDVEHKAFALTIAPVLLAQGNLDLLFLQCGGERVAASWAVRHEKRMTAYLGAFAPVEGLRNVFRPMVAHALRSAIEQGCSVFDMHLGDQDYKFEWGVTDVHEYWRIRSYGATLAGRMRRQRDRVVERRAGQKVLGAAARS